MKIQMEIKNCSQCPNHTSERIYYADSFDCNDFSWFCTKLNREIGIEDLKTKPNIPKDCPIKV